MSQKHKLIMVHVIVDGYNLIRQTPALMRYERQSLEAGRQRLLQMLSQYKKLRPHKITVVFDGTQTMSEFGSSYKEAGILVRFSSEGKDADAVIKEMAREEKARALIVTSDQSIIRYVITQGSSFTSSPDFYEKIIQADLMGPLDKTEDNDKIKKPHKRWLTCKKGPSKRRPKKDRLNSRRLQKL